MAPNKYDSVLRTYTTRNVYEATLTTGNDIVVPTTPNLRFAGQFAWQANVQTNFMIRRLGVFSNFADGLVFKNPQERIDVYSIFEAWQATTLDGTITCTIGSKAFTTSAAQTWAVGTPIVLAITVGVGMVVLVSATPSGANAGSFDDYWYYNTDDYAMESVSPILSDNPINVWNISTLNNLYELHEFGKPFDFGGGGEYKYISTRQGINYNPEHDTTFLTNAIDSVFDDSTVTFDVVSEIEFTSKDS